MSDLYETDVLTWSERQAELLRRRAAGERVNEDEIDWLNVAETRLHRDDARDDYLASMRDKIDMAKRYRRALRGMPDTIDGQPPGPVPAECPMTLEELIAE